MVEQIYIAGYGGQGALSTGQLLAHAVLLEGRYVSYVPVYGVEKRGGIANCGVTISNLPICSPIVNEPTILVVMNNYALQRFENDVVPGGLVFVNSSLVDVPVKRNDTKSFLIKANEEAEALGDVRVANNILLGALIQFTNVVSIKSVEQSLIEVLPERLHNLLDVNIKALERGAQLAGVLQ